jgi:hypothetical protein
LIWKNRKKFLLEELGLYVFFLLQGISSTRHIPLWIIFSIPMSVRAFGFTFDSVKKIHLGQTRFKLVYKWALYGSLALLFLQSVYALMGAQTLSLKRFYPEGAVGFLGENLPSGQIFSEYGWGGYLIWKLPQKKVFVDGRMPSWRYKDNPQEESDYAMRDYIDLLEGEISYLDVFKKYGVDTVVWSIPKKESNWDSFLKKLEKLISKKKDTFDLITKLEEDGWEKVFSDEVAAVYKKPQ